MDRGDSKFGHKFGGAHDRRGADRNSCDGLLIHLLHRLNLDDPEVPISVPGIKWLPLYYVFDYRANELGYQLLSDDEMTTFFPEDENIAGSEEWPFEDYPLEFPESSIIVSRYDYDPTEPKDAKNWAGIFGISKLAEQEQETMKSALAKRLVEIGYYKPETEEDLMEYLSEPLIQGRPDSSCLNPECSNFNHRKTLDIIATISPEPIAGLRLWGRMDVQLIYEMCPKCYTIRVSNQCT